MKIDVCGFVNAFSFSKEKYTIKNALLWGNCREHFEMGAASFGSHKVVHFALGTIEAIPLIGQIVSLIEMLFVRALGAPCKPKPKVVAPVVIPKSEPLRSVAQPHQQLFSECHQLLLDHSSQYRKMIEAIQNRKQMPIAFMDRQTAVVSLRQANQHEMATSIEKFEFYACWMEVLNAVIVMEPSQYPGHSVAGIMAFEVTNGYQQQRFEQMHQEALNGAYEDFSLRYAETRVNRAAMLYAQAMERIEADGIDLQRTVLKEVLADNIDTSGWQLQWDRPGFMSTIHASQYGQNHIAYYEKHYRTHVAPVAAEKRGRDFMVHLRKQGAVNTLAPLAN